MMALTSISASVIIAGPAAHDLQADLIPARDASDDYCSGCGRSLPPGGHAYEVRLTSPRGYTLEYSACATEQCVHDGMERAL